MYVYQYAHQYIYMYIPGLQCKSVKVVAEWSLFSPVWWGQLDSDRV